MFLLPVESLGLSSGVKIALLEIFHLDWCFCCSSRPEFDHSSALAGEFDPSDPITDLREKYLKLRFPHLQPVVSLSKSVGSYG